MKLFIRQLTLSCKQEQETLSFTDFNYYYGQMGAGKSTIARLIDFCLGGALEYSLAIQEEFVAASLELEVEAKPLALSRNSGANHIRAQWSESQQAYDVLLPARQAGGEVLPNTDIELPSDLLFRLAGVQPPRVRGSKDSDSTQDDLAFPDLYPYCYLDQDSMDSNFFGLAARQKSRDVIRHLVGWHHESVMELDAQLQAVRADRKRCDHTLKAIGDALASEHLPTPKEIAAVRQSLEQEIQNLDARIAAARAGAAEVRPHGIERLQNTGRRMALQLADLDDALNEISENVAKDKTHRNTLLSLATRQKRAESARSILGTVEFAQCPRCLETLPARPDGLCSVCGQPHAPASDNPVGDGAVEADIKARADELEERIKLQTQEIARLRHRREALAAQKAALDRELNHAMARYDSAYLTNALQAETERARLAQKLADLHQPESLATKVEQHREAAARLSGQEAELRAKLKAARAEAQRDTANLDLLKRLFLDCLVRSRLPGFRADDSVEISPPNFLPHVHGKDTPNFTSFANLGSGSKKCFFKACFAVALHRLAASTGALWPTIFIVDSPMKNTSERENTDQFKGFYQMLYDLKETELKATQFIVIDKDFVGPASKPTFGFQKRHMTPDDAANPPLIGYYRGK